MEQMKEIVKSALGEKARREQLRKERELHEQAMEEANAEAARLMVEFGKSEWQVTPRMSQVDAVEKAMEVAGCNSGKYPKEIRRIQCWMILRHCINPCNHSELRKIEVALLNIAEPGSGDVHVSAFK